VDYRASTLGPGQVLPVNQPIASPNGQFQLVLQPDGDLALRDNQNGVLWSSGTSGQTVSQCIMRTDGNLVIYGRPSGPEPGPEDVLWSSRTEGNPGSFLRVTDQGRLVIYRPRTPIWASPAPGQQQVVQ
jgi:hypothetical protein